MPYFPSRSQNHNNQKLTRVNHQIRVPRVTVIDADGSNLGELSTSDALGRAKDKDLDLVEVGPNMHPPIVKIMDYGKYRYEKERKSKAGKKKGSEKEVKNIRIGFTTSEHDMRIKADKLTEMLKNGHRIVIDMRLKGREKALNVIAKERLDLFISFINEEFELESIKRLPNGWNAFLKPVSKK